MTATVRGATPHAREVRRTFLADRIVTTYVLRGPRSAIARIRLPVWSRAQPRAAPGRHAPRAAARSRSASASPPAATARSCAPAAALGTHWSVIRHPPRSSPGTRGVLEVRLRLAHSARPCA